MMTPLECELSEFVDDLVDFCNFDFVIIFESIGIMSWIKNVIKFFLYFTARFLLMTKENVL